TNYNAPTTNPVFNSLSITKRNTVVTVVCNPVNPPKDSATSCTATVADDPANGGTSPGTPSGTVQWSFSGGNGGFGVLPGPLSPTTSCPLSAGSCAVSLTPTQAKVYTVIANYQGDSSPDVY